MIKSPATPTLIAIAAVACSSGKAPKEAFDQAFGRGKKNDAPFVANIADLKGYYKDQTLPSAALVVYFDSGKLEIAAKGGAQLKGCSKAQAVNQIGNTHAEVEAIDTCAGFSFDVAAQGMNNLNIVVSGNALNLIGVPSFRLADEMFGWPAESRAAFPPTIEALQYQDVTSADMASRRSEFKTALTGATVELSKDLTLESSASFSVIYVANGEVGRLETLLDTIITKKAAPDTICALRSASKQTTVGAFKRNLARLTVDHVNRSEGHWTFEQLHVGIDNILTPEQRRIPTEDTQPAVTSANSVEIWLEATDSEVKGGPTKRDADLSISCSKSQKSAPIGLEDVKKALGEVVRFAN